MRELHYGNGTLVVSFGICEAVVNYAVALAEAGHAASVTIPILRNGARGDSELVLGPASQLFSTPADDTDVDLDDPDVIEELRTRTAALLPRRAVFDEESEPYQFLDFPDEFE